MLRLNPFRALRPLPNLAPSVACVPYDVLSTTEARALAKGNPNSFLHVIRPEIDLPEDTNPYDEIVYEKARQNLDRLFAEGVLVQEIEPTMYLYRQVLNHTLQTGLVCCCHIEDYANNIIKKHEKTRPDKEDDRMRHMLSLNANPGPVFLTYRDHEDIEVLVAKDINDRPLFHFNSPDGVTHTVWTVHDPQVYIDAFAGIEAAYVADGHHRSAAAARAGAQLRAANPNHRGDEEYNWFMTVLFPASQLTILPYNRVIADLNGKTLKTVFAELAEIGRLTETDDPKPDRPGVFCLYLDGRWHKLELDPGSIDQTDPITSLDVDLLQNRILTPIFGIGDPRTDGRIDFVGGARGTDELKNRVDSRQAALAISMFATSIEQLLEVSDADLVMPPKSTWFEPKLRSGLFTHRLE